MQYYNLHTHVGSNRDHVLDVVNQYPLELDITIPFYSVGIHPWYIKEENIAQELIIIEEQLQQPNCLALGECGLDKRIEVPFSLQVEVFEKQLLLAQRYNKPVIIHCVKAFQEVIACRKNTNTTVPMIIHGFSKNKTVAQQLIKNGFYLSFGKYLLRNPALETVFTAVPENKIFLETDTIEETIEQVYALAAYYKKIELEKLEQIITTNFNTVFKNGSVD